MIAVYEIVNQSKYYRYFQNRYTKKILKIQKITLFSFLNYHVQIILKMISKDPKLVGAGGALARTDFVVLKSRTYH